MSKYAEIPQHIQDLADARAEIERLKAEIERRDEGIAQQVLEQKIEIERLRGDIKLLNSFRSDAELARLRGLLREAEKMWPNPGLSSESSRWYKRVREALGDE